MKKIKKTLDAWYTHFSYVLGVSSVNEQNDVTPKVLDDIEIYDNPFTMDELCMRKAPEDSENT